MKIFREPVEVTAHCLVEDFSGNLIKLGQVRIEHDFVPANKVNLAFDEFDWDYLNSR